MKKAFVLIVIAVALGLLYFANNKPADVTRTQEATEDGSVRPDPSNATFIFDDGPITLSGGTAIKEIEGSSFLSEEINIWGDFIAYGDLNDDKRSDAGVIITRSGGVSGFFIYVAPFLSQNGSYKGGNAIYLGDRVVPQEISISNDVLTVRYLDRADGEPLAAEPTVTVTKQFVIRSGNLMGI